MHARTREKLENILGLGIKNVKAVSGGDIAEAYLIETASQRIFCKIMRGSSALGTLAAEMDGLEQIRNTKSIKTPQVYFCENLGDQVCLGMEFIESKTPAPAEMQRLGEQLAQMHNASSENFGYHKDNFIGSLSQTNTEYSSWTPFYVEQRLLPQLQLAVSKNLMQSAEVPEIQTMTSALSPYFKAIKPSLLHGDLWSGNYLISTTGEPYLIDPAVYYGDRVVDLAMTRLFGGFGPDFYKAYKASSHVLENEEDKTQLYQLYYLLVHLNLFGRSYYGSVNRIMRGYF